MDASNYVMLELGKPVHTFDAAAVHGDRIGVRLARDGERLETLDHVDRALTPDTLLITDERGPLAIAGVMGGAASEVSDATSRVIIESAIFDPVSIRRTVFRYALRSEASLRFEKGQDHGLALMGATFCGESERVQPGEALAATAAAAEAKQRFVINFCYAQYRSQSDILRCLALGV